MQSALAEDSSNVEPPLFAWLARRLTVSTLRGV